MSDTGENIMPSRPRAAGEARHRSRSRDDVLANIVLAHLGALIVGTSWAFGGQSPGARIWLLIWGTLGILLFFVAQARRADDRPAPRFGALRDLWPLVLFDLCVGASCLNPSFQTIFRDGLPYFILQDPPYRWLPSSARPELTLRELWQFNGIVLSCYNAFLVLHSRRKLRQVLFVVALNALVLAVFGTFQKLVGAKGLWFGLVPSPQEHFFSTFVYHNHWGAFTVLNTAACLGLFFHALRRGGYRDLWHSPVPAGALATLLLAVAVPLSASRSSTALTCVLLGAATIHLLWRTIRRRREHHESALLPVAGILLCVLLALAAIVYLGRDVIQQRARLTTEQLARIRHEDTLNSRLTLYRDTWRMASLKPWFGWGLETYGDVFRVYNSQRAVEVWFGQPYYREAHSDWLQAFAEVGAVGTALLVLLGALPLRLVRWSKVESILPGYLLAGCALILLYAWVEFPFANPSVMIAFWTSLYVAARYATLDLGAQSAENHA
ncbi:MAG: O-antigen ligase family protein [Opitutae bacterium]|nr:O-antigen ligase family protein [Opitutae bacterium]